jgi:DNA-binding transcriptional LysR family regulator
MNLRELAIFVAVAETGGIPAASARLGRTASTISTALKQLQQDVGAALFEGDRKNRLTDLGKLMVAQGRELLDHYDRTRKAIYAFAGNETGRTDVACVPSFAITFLPEIIGRLSRVRPAVQVMVRDIDSRSVRDAVGSGTADVGVATALDMPPELEFMPLFTDQLSLVCRDDSPLAAAEVPISWRELQKHRFLAHGSYGMITDPVFISIAEHAEVHVRNVLSLLALVKAGIGVTLLPRLYQFQSDERLRFVPVEDPNARRIVGIIVRRARHHSPATTRFLQIVRDVVWDNRERLGLDVTVPESTDGEGRRPRLRHRQRRARSRL